MLSFNFAIPLEVSCGRLGGEVAVGVAIRAAAVGWFVCLWHGLHGCAEGICAHLFVGDDVVGVFAPCGLEPLDEHGSSAVLVEDDAGDLAELV